VVKRRYLVLIIVISIILAGSVGVYYISYEFTTHLTAMKAKEIADPIAKNWSPTACLVSLRKVPVFWSIHLGTMDIPIKYGSAWELTYTINSTDLSKGISISVISNRNTEIRYDIGIGEAKPIYNWSIDSDVAERIAMSDKNISTFISKHSPDPKTFALTWYNETLFWYISWSEPVGFAEGSYCAEIKIDATTGEVLFSSADLDAPPTLWYYPAMNNIYFVCCTIPVIIIIMAIIALAVYYYRKKRKRQSTQ